MDFLNITLIILGFAVLIFFINKKLNDIFAGQKPSGDLLEYLKTTNARLDEQGRTFNLRLDHATRVIADVQRNIGEMSEIGRGIKELEDFLKNPKLRGNIGEQILNELLKQYLPKESFNLQYVFRSGEKVDAAIKTSAGIIPVDSKFPMENFRKMGKAESDVERKRTQRDFEIDVRKHIDDIARKYILTEEGTIDYALMYIPSEAVYYEVVNNSALFEYSGDKRVLPVSPTTFYAYMKAILMSFEGQKIESQAKEILSAIRAIEKDYEKVGSSLSVLQRHVTNAHNMMAEVVSIFSQLGHKISSTRKLGSNSNKSGKKPEED